MSSVGVEHSPAFLRRRRQTCVALGVAFALLFMARYNLTVAKVSLGGALSTEAFGAILGWGSLVFVVGLALHGPIVDRIGGRKGILIGLTGACLSNLCLGVFLMRQAAVGEDCTSLARIVGGLFCVNMYFQSLATMSVVKVCSRWFHVSERGVLGSLLGVMLASGLFLAFAVNPLVLEAFESRLAGVGQEWSLFLVPSLFLGGMAGFLLSSLRESPKHAGFAEFNTGDRDGTGEGERLGAAQLAGRTFLNPMLVVFGAIEFCTGVVRGAVLHWVPIYATEVWRLPDSHVLVYGSWDWPQLVFIGLVIGTVLWLLGREAQGRMRVALGALAIVCVVVPFLQGGWGGLLLVSGVLGSAWAGWRSDTRWQSRRGPVAAGLFSLILVASVALLFVLKQNTGNVVGWASDDAGLRPGDRVLAVGRVDPVVDWAQVSQAAACRPADCSDVVACDSFYWDSERCSCSSEIDARRSIIGLANRGDAPRIAKLMGVEELSTAAVREALAELEVNEVERMQRQLVRSLYGYGLPVTYERAGRIYEEQIPDAKLNMQSRERDPLLAGPKTDGAPFLVLVVFVLGMAFLACHGLLLGAATVDFGGSRAAATSVAFVEGMVHLGIAFQAFVLGNLSAVDWTYWPLLVIVFAFVGVALSLRVWNAKATGS